MTQIPKPKFKIVALDYKGKHFILCDEDSVSEEESLDKYVDVEKVISSEELLKEHVIECDYYGIPPYLGEDENLNKRIEKLRKELIEI